MTKKELAIALHDKNYNCAQSVACALADTIGADEELVFQACEGFGLGMGCTQGTCGAVSGAVMLAGLKNSDGLLRNPQTKASTYKLSALIVDKFEKKNGSLICKELKGTETGKVLRPCPDCIMDAVEIAEEVLDLK